MRLLLALVGLALLPAAAPAAPELVRVGTFDAPVYVASPPGDPRLFVVERAGTIRVVGADDAVREEPFADLRSLTTTDGERGLLSIAFPPDYATSGLAYVYVTARDGELQIRELRRSAADADRAEPGAGRLVIAQAHARFSNHNGGQVAFGPDGLLYAGMGDGGSSNDPDQNGQRLSTLLGKLIRIDPRATASGPYAVPADNPFAGQADARPEIWSYGLRNPFRFSFDRANGDLWLSDVGQGAREEVSLGRRDAGGGRGANYGWRCFEGSIRTPGVPACEAPGHVPPLFDLDHDADGACSITGGVVVRDRGLPTLAGRYVHSDLCDTRIRSAAGDGDKSTPAGLSASGLVGFGEDACGRVYPVSIEGPVYRLRDGAATPCDPRERQAPGAPAGPGGGPGGGPTGGSGGTTADRTPCRIAVRRRSRQRVGALRLAVTTSERCTVRATLRVRGVATLRSAARTLAAGRRSTLKIGVRGASGARLRRAVRRRSAHRRPHRQRPRRRRQRLERHAAGAGAPLARAVLVVPGGRLAGVGGGVGVGRAARDRVALVVVGVVDLLPADLDRAVLEAPQVRRAELGGRRLLVVLLGLGAAEGLVLGLAARPVLEPLGRVVLEGLDLLLGLLGFPLGLLGLLRRALVLGHLASRRCPLLGPAIPGRSPPRTAAGAWRHHRASPLCQIAA